MARPNTRRTAHSRGSTARPPRAGSAALPTTGSGGDGAAGEDGRTRADATPPPAAASRLPALGHLITSQRSRLHLLRYRHRRLLAQRGEVLDGISRTAVAYSDAVKCASRADSVRRAATDAATSLLSPLVSATHSRQAVHLWRRTASGPLAAKLSAFTLLRQAASVGRWPVSEQAASAAVPAPASTSAHHVHTRAPNASVSVRAAEVGVVATEEAALTSLQRLLQLSVEAVALHPGLMHRVQPFSWETSPLQSLGAYCAHEHFSRAADASVLSAAAAARVCGASTLLLSRADVTVAERTHTVPHTATGSCVSEGTQSNGMVEEAANGVATDGVTRRALSTYVDALLAAVPVVVTTQGGGGDTDAINNSRHPEGDAQCDSAFRRAPVPSSSTGRAGMALCVSNADVWAAFESAAPVAMTDAPFHDATSNQGSVDEDVPMSMVTVEDEGGLVVPSFLSLREEAQLLAHSHEADERDLPSPAHGVAATQVQHSDTALGASEFALHQLDVVSRVRQAVSRLSTTLQARFLTQAHALALKRVHADHGHILADRNTERSVTSSVSLGLRSAHNWVVDEGRADLLMMLSSATWQEELLPPANANTGEDIDDAGAALTLLRMVVLVQRPCENRKELEAAPAAAWPEEASAPIRVLHSGQVNKCLKDAHLHLCWKWFATACAAAHELERRARASAGDDAIITAEPFLESLRPGGALHPLTGPPVLQQQPRLHMVFGSAAGDSVRHLERRTMRSADCEQDDCSAPPDARHLSAKKERIFGLLERSKELAAAVGMPAAANAAAGTANVGRATNGAADEGEPPTPVFHDATPAPMLPPSVSTFSAQEVLTEGEGVGADSIASVAAVQHPHTAALPASWSTPAWALSAGEATRAGTRYHSIVATDVDKPSWQVGYHVPATVAAQHLESWCTLAQTVHEAEAGAVPHCHVAAMSQQACSRWWPLQLVWALSRTTVACLQGDAHAYGRHEHPVHGLGVLPAAYPSLVAAALAWNVGALDPDTWLRLSNAEAAAQMQSTLRSVRSAWDAVLARHNPSLHLLPQAQLLRVLVKLQPQLHNNMTSAAAASTPSERTVGLVEAARAEESHGSATTIPSGSRLLHAACLLLPSLFADTRASSAASPSSPYQVLVRTSAALNAAMARSGQHALSLVGGGLLATACVRLLTAASPPLVRVHTTISAQIRRLAALPTANDGAAQTFGVVPCSTRSEAGWQALHLALTWLRVLHDARDEEGISLAFDSLFRQPQTQTKAPPTQPLPCPVPQLPALPRDVYEARLCAALWWVAWETTRQLPPHTSTIAATWEVQGFPLHRHAVHAYAALARTQPGADDVRRARAQRAGSALVTELAVWIPQAAAGSWVHAAAAAMDATLVLLASGLLSNVSALAAALAECRVGPDVSPCDTSVSAWEAALGSAIHWPPSILSAWLSHALYDPATALRVLSLRHTEGEASTGAALPTSFVATSVASPRTVLRALLACGVRTICAAGARGHGTDSVAFAHCTMTHVVVLHNLVHVANAALELELPRAAIATLQLVQASMLWVLKPDAVKELQLPFSVAWVAAPTPQPALSWPWFAAIIDRADDVEAALSLDDVALAALSRVGATLLALINESSHLLPAQARVCPHLPGALFVQCMQSLVTATVRALFVTEQQPWAVVVSALQRWHAKLLHDVNVSATVQVYGLRSLAPAAFAMVPQLSCLVSALEECVTFYVDVARVDACLATAPAMGLLGMPAWVAPLATHCLRPAPLACSPAPSPSSCATRHKVSVVRMVTDTIAALDAVAPAAQAAAGACLPVDNTHDAASACADALANVLQFAAVANFSAWLAVSTRHMVAAHSARLLCVVRSDTEGVPASGSEVFDLSEAPNPDAFTWAARAGWQRPGTHENESLRAAQAPASPASPHWSAHPVLVASAERIARGADVRVRHVVAGDAAGSHTLGWGTCAPIEPFMHALTAACAQRALCCVQLLVAVERGDTGSESTLRAGLVAALPSAALALTRDVMADGPVSQTHPPWARSSGSAATAALQELLRAVPLAARRNGVASDVHTATSVMRGLCEVVAGTAVDNTVARTLQQVHSFRWCTQRASVLPDEWWIALDEHPTAPALHAGLSVFRSPHATLGAAMRRAQSRLAASGISEHLVRTVLDACGAFAYNVRLREAAATLAIGCMHRACGSRAASMASPYIVASFASMWRLPHDEVLTPSTPVASASTPADDSAAGAGATSSAATLPAPAAAASQQQPVSRPAPAAAGAHRGLRHDPT